MEKNQRMFRTLLKGSALSLSKANSETLEFAERLKVIATVSTGLNHIDLDYCQQRGIKVLSLEENTPVLNRCTATADDG